MTREEAKEFLLSKCKILNTYSWSEDKKDYCVPHYILSDSKALNLIDHEAQLKAKDECIRELEGAMKPKTCSSCKYWDFNEQGHFKRCFNGKGNVVSTEADFGCRFHKLKDTQ